MPPSRVFVTGCCSALAVLALTACQPVVPPVVPSPTATATSSPTPTPSPTPTADFTRPGAARTMLDRLLAAAGPGKLIMVEVTTQTAAVSVLTDTGSEPVTWAYRDHEIQQVASDLQYVDQASFTLSDFDLADVGRLFRIAAVASEATDNQTLQIVDYSGGRVMMTVTTNPESRTVFFNPDGSLLPELDYHTEGGIAAGLADVLDGRVVARQVGVDSETGAWADFAGPDDTTVRYQRPAKVPVTTVTRDDPPPLTPFPVGGIDAHVIWQVVRRTLQAHDLDPATAWSVTADDRGKTGTPQLHFQIGSESVVTDLTGLELPKS